jgi:hypothetical protein
VFTYVSSVHQNHQPIASQASYSSGPVRTQEQGHVQSVKKKVKRVPRNKNKATLRTCSSFFFSPVLSFLDTSYYLGASKASRLCLAL